MKLTQRNKRLLVEQLEDRVTPSLTMTYFGSTLIMRGTPDNVGGGGLQITGEADGTFQIMDGTSFLGRYHVQGNILVLLNSHPAGITMNLSALPNSTYAGNVYMNLGVGDTNSTFLAPVSIVGGTIGGNLAISGGRGFEDIDLGASNDSTTAAPVHIGGSVTVLASNNTPPAAFVTAPNNVTLAPGSSIAGNLTTRFVDTVNIGNFLTGGTALASIGGNVSIDNTNGGEALFVEMTGSIGGNLSATGTGQADNTNGLGPGTSPYGGAVEITPNGVTGGGQVGGNVYINLGNNDIPTLPGGVLGTGSNVNIDGDGTNSAIIGGNVTVVNSGGSADSITIGTINNAQILGNLAINLGNGANSVTLGSTPTAASLAVNGNIGITAGNGNDLLHLNGSVNGGLGIQLGNGMDTATVGTTVGGLTTWNSGNGADSFQLGSGTNFYDVNAQFGNNNDTFTLATAGLVSGNVNGGGRLTANAFNQGSAILTPFFQLSNFP